MARRNRARIGLWVALCVAGAVAGAARTAGAQTPPPASREAIERALALREHGDEEGALRLFTELWERDHSAETRAQMALVEQALGLWLRADEHMREAMASTNDPWIHRNRAALERAYENVADHVGRLDVQSPT